MASLALEFVSEARRVGAHISPRARRESPRREEAESRTRTVNTWRKNRSDVPAISSLRSRDRRMHRVRASNELFFFSLSLSPCLWAVFKNRASTHLDVSRARYRGRFAATDKRDRVARRCSDTLDGPDDRRDVHSTLSLCTY